VGCFAGHCFSFGAGLDQSLWRGAVLADPRRAFRIGLRNRQPELEVPVPELMVVERIRQEGRSRRDSFRKGRYHPTLWVVCKAGDAKLERYIDRCSFDRLIHTDRFVGASRCLLPFVNVTGSRVVHGKWAGRIEKAAVLSLFQDQKACWCRGSSNPQVAFSTSNSCEVSAVISIGHLQFELQWHRRRRMLTASSSLPAAETGLLPHVRRRAGHYECGCLT
jgi:hypothetical protein